MVYGLGLGAVFELCLIAYCLLDCLTTPAARCRNLPKPVWVILCFVPPFLGPISWLVFGRPRGPAEAGPYKGNRGVPPEYDRPGRATAANPDDDAAFLAQLRERAEEQRRRAAEQAEQIRRQQEPPPV